MNVLLSGRLDAVEYSTWKDHLCRAVPAVNWLDLAAAEASPDDVEVAVVANPAPASLRPFRRLRLIQSLWAGVEGLLTDGTLPEGVPLARMVDPAMTAAMVQTVQWAVLALHRHCFDYERQQRQRLWRPLPQSRAEEVRVLVLGRGEMGAAASAALAGMGYAVAAWSLSARAGPVPGIVPLTGDGALRATLADSDIVVNLLPLTAATTGLIDAGFIARLPRGACVVNLARGRHVVEPALLAALDSGHLRHAVLDVFATEPLPDNHPFWQHPAVTVLPHAAAQTDPRSAAAVVAANLDAIRQGRPVRHLVDRARGY
jgi:glyoxylate/hydroxypyruvate reductase A